jgi:hypothetical protein
MGRREEGAVAIIVAIVLVVIVAATALAVDVGGLMLRRRGLVNSSDAAALSAARTCARGGVDDHGTTEEAADAAALANSHITIGEVAGTNIISALSTLCGEVSGYVTVGYTSQQRLFFAPTLGFNSESPVHTQATASWGLGANGAMPLVLSGQLVSTCPKPPPVGTNTIGQPECGTWYDNDEFGNGNFGFLSLKPEGWDTPQGDCKGPSNPSANDLNDWVTGVDIESVALNWLEPTFACSGSGLKDTTWKEIDKLAGQVRDFPITWDGCDPDPSNPNNEYVWCPPTGTAAPSQGVVYKSGDIYQYDVIGFAAMKIIGVVDWADAGPTVTTTQQPFLDFTHDNTAITFQRTLPIGAVADYTWTKVKNGTTVSARCLFTTTAAFSGSVLWKDFGKTGQCPGSNDVVTGVTNITITEPVTTTTPGPCGPRPNDNSARCLMTQWLGSTLTGDYPADRLDHVRVVRLCDLAVGPCLHPG